MVLYITYCYLSTCGPQISPQSPVWPFAIERFETHDTHFTARSDTCLSGNSIKCNLRGLEL